MYSHRISFDILSSVTKMWAAASFPTTEDAVAMHVAKLQSKRIVRNIKVERIRK